MDLDRVKRELFNEYKLFDIQVATSPYLTHTKYSTTLSIITFFITFHFFFPSCFHSEIVQSWNLFYILFKMTIDPTVSSKTFADIDEFSYFKTKQEVLFSMHIVFRICEINKIDNNNRIYQVDIKLTSDDDKQLRALPEQIREEIDPKVQRWD